MINRILWLSLLFLSVVLLLGLTACSTQPTKTESVTIDTQSINHVVLVWFKQGTTTADIDEVIQETNKLPALIPQVKAMSLGRSIASDRKIVDDSFDLGIHLTFSNQQDMQAYLSHPKHVTFVNKFVKPRLAKLLVYDF
jgi:predicted nucleic acid-binding protein